MTNAGKARILAVDDDPAHLLSTREILEAEGYEVFTYDRGFGVTNLVRELKPQLVLLDINMPALSGDSLAQILKVNSETRGIPIVFYSSNDEDWLRQEVVRRGVLGYVSKGNPQTLRTRVAHYLSLPGKPAS